MADQLRYRRGETNPVFVPVGSSTVISIGDMVYQDSNAAKPANDLADAGTTEQNQDAFHNNFLGVAGQASESGSTDPIRVATEGEFEFDCAAATFSLGQLVGPAIASNNKCENQKVVAVSLATLAIGRVAKRYATNTTKVLVRIESTVMKGGPVPIPDTSGS